MSRREWPGDCQNLVEIGMHLDKIGELFQCRVETGRFAGLDEPKMPLRQSDFPGARQCAEHVQSGLLHGASRKITVPLAADPIKDDTADLNARIEGCAAQSQRAGGL